MLILVMLIEATDFSVTVSKSIATQLAFIDFTELLPPAHVPTHKDHLGYWHEELYYPCHAELLGYCTLKYGCQAYVEYCGDNCESGLSPMMVLVKMILENNNKPILVC